MSKMKIKYVVLAKSIPEYSKRDGICYTCSLGYSPELGLIRIYPLPISSMNKWDVYEISVERNKYDTRSESWKLSTYARKENWVGLEKDVTPLYKADPKDMVNIISRYRINSIKELNEQKKSIGLIQLKIIKFIGTQIKGLLIHPNMAYLKMLKLPTLPNTPKNQRQKRQEYISGMRPANMTFNIIHGEYMNIKESLTPQMKHSDLFKTATFCLLAICTITGIIG